MTPRLPLFVAVALAVMTTALTSERMVGIAVAGAPTDLSDALSISSRAKVNNVTWTWAANVPYAGSTPLASLSPATPTSGGSGSTAA